uniref:Uncharacterized protein n=1 Tax=Brassica oleracea TaxID=3712 RepID=A0A3P6EB15_BRAOL|nr:unnamed protein product [Brassica oleracea]
MRHMLMETHFLCVQKTVAKSKSKKKGKLNSQPSSPHIDIGDFVDGRDDEQIRAPNVNRDDSGEIDYALDGFGELDHTQVKDLKTTIYLLTPTSPELDVTKPQDMVRPGSLSLLAEAYDRCVQVCAEYAKKIYLG